MYLGLEMCPISSPPTAAPLPSLLLLSVGCFRVVGQRVLIDIAILRRFELAGLKLSGGGGLSLSQGYINMTSRMLANMRYKLPLVFLRFFLFIFLYFILYEQCNCTGKKTNILFTNGVD